MSQTADEQNRLREDAKRDAEVFALKQKAAEKSRLQLKLGNLNLDLGKLQRELAARELKIREVKQREGDTARKIMGGKSIQQHDTRIAELKLTLDRLTRSTDGARSNLLFKVEQAQVKAGEIKRGESALKTTIAQGNIKISSLKARLARINHESPGVRSGLSIKERQEETSGKEFVRHIAELKIKIDRLADELARAKADLVDQESKLQKEKIEETDTKKKIADEYSTEKSRHGEVSRLQIEIDRLTDDLARAKNDIFYMESELQKARRAEVDAKREIAEKNSSEQRRQQEIRSLQTQIDRLANSEKDARENLGMKERQIKADAQALEADATKLKAEMEKIKMAIDDVLRQISQIR